ncbi:hypothetical protein GF412_02105 [Candidatus Micrarchaeota archaeon]|nr:hypothetical protein [Candidatus Micrarchaeota archaeon]MBD3417755.1 hypothetical protein [Candidatus Micrarchaeota archaeon]
MLNPLDYLVLNMVEKGDFILLELEGKDQDGRVFDSTEGEVAKKLHGKQGPLLVVFGMDRLIPGIYDALIGMKQDEEKKVHLTPEEAFGHRKKDLVKIMSSSEFAKHQVNPEPGLVIHVDTDNGRIYGTVKSVTGGRVMVDFNHPIAGQEVDYTLKLKKIFTRPEEKIKELMDYLELEGDFDLSKEGELSVKIKKKEGQDYEMHKAMFLVTAKSKIGGVTKVDLKEE